MQYIYIIFILSESFPPPPSFQLPFFQSGSHCVALAGLELLFDQVGPDLICLLRMPLHPASPL